VNRKALFFLLTAILFLFSTGCFDKVPLTVTNGLQDYNIHCIYISRDSDNLWGTNHLPGTDILEPDKSAEVMVAQGVYDIQVTDEDGDTYTIRGVTVGSDGFNWIVTLENLDQTTPSTPANLQNAGPCPVVVTNSLGSWNITGIWISPAASESWGDNYLGAELLYPGDTYTANVQPGFYDIYLEDEDGDTYTRLDVEVTSIGYTWEAALSDLDSGGT
jgi:hypothetical protein